MIDRDLRMTVSPAIACLFTVCLFATGFAQIANGQTVSTFAGTGEKGFSGDGGPADEARLNNPFAVARGPDDGPDGAIFICDVDNHRIRRVNADGIIDTVAGSGRQGYDGDGGQAIDASLNQPYEIAWDANGHLFFVEVGNHCVRRIDAQTQLITTVAGTGVAGFAGDGGPARNAQLDRPHSLAFGGDGNLYVCDIRNHRVRRIEMDSGTISTWIGTGEKKTSPDGTLIEAAALNGPRAIAFSPDGNCWLALREGNALMLLSAESDTIRRVAGTGKSGFTGNGGPALQATLSGPKCVSLDAAGNVYLADTESHSIRYLDVEKNTIELLVGNGEKGDGPDGDSPLNCRLARPHGVFVDRDGSIYMGDSENHRVRVRRE